MLMPSSGQGAGRVVLTANSMRNLAHFRRPLFEAFRKAGIETVALAPDDGEGPDADLVEHISMDRRGANPLRDFGTIRHYRQVLRRLRPDAVFGFTPKANIYGAIAARGLDIPFIPTVSGLGTAFLKGGLLQTIQTQLYRVALSKCPVVLFQNDDDRRLFVEKGLVSAGRALTVPGSGIDLDHFAMPPPDDEAAPNLLFIGRLLVDKGVVELMDAVRLLRAQGVEFSLTVVGDHDEGNPSAIEPAQLERWAGEDLAEFAGQVADIRPYLRCCHAVVLPSYREGLPRSLLEAAAASRPMIATDVPGCRQLVRPNDTGLLCEPKSAASLAHAIASFLSMPSRDRHRMGANARRLVEQGYSQDLVADRYLACLAELGLNVPAGKGAADG